MSSQNTLGVDSPKLWRQNLWDHDHGHTLMTSIEVIPHDLYGGQDFHDHGHTLMTSMEVMTSISHITVSKISKALNYDIAYIFFMFQATKAVKRFSVSGALLIKSVRQVLQGLMARGLLVQFNITGTGSKQRRSLNCTRLYHLLTGLEQLLDN